MRLTFSKWCVFYFIFFSCLIFHVSKCHKCHIRSFYDQLSNCTWAPPSHQSFLLPTVTTSKWWHRDKRNRGHQHSITVQRPIFTLSAVMAIHIKVAKLHLQLTRTYSAGFVPGRIFGAFSNICAKKLIFLFVKCLWKKANWAIKCTWVGKLLVATMMT